MNKQTKYILIFIGVFLLIMMFFYNFNDKKEDSNSPFYFVNCQNISYSESFRVEASRMVQFTTNDFYKFECLDFYSLTLKYNNKIIDLCQQSNWNIKTNASERMTMVLKEFESNDAQKIELDILPYRDGIIRSGIERSNVEICEVSI